MISVEELPVTVVSNFCYQTSVQKGISGYTGDCMRLPVPEERDDKDRVIAEIEDYWMALQIVQEAFRENLGQESKGNEVRITYIEENGPVQYRDLEEAWGIKRQSVSTWIAPRVKEGVIVWCGEDGNEFTDEKEMRKVQRSGKGYVKVSASYNAADTIGLPTPYDLTEDPDWDEGGGLLKKYDLKLDSRTGVKVYQGVREVSIPAPDTYDDSEPLESVDDSVDDAGVVRVSGCQVRIRRWMEIIWNQTSRMISP